MAGGRCSGAARRRALRECAEQRFHLRRHLHHPDRSARSELPDRRAIDRQLLVPAQHRPPVPPARDGQLRDQLGNLPRACGLPPAEHPDLRRHVPGRLPPDARAVRLVLGRLDRRGVLRRPSNPHRAAEPDHRSGGFGRHVADAARGVALLAGRGPRGATQSRQGAAGRGLFRGRDAVQRERNHTDRRRDPAGLVAVAGRHAGGPPAMAVTPHRQMLPAHAPGRARLPRRPQTGRRSAAQQHRRCRSVG